MVGMTWKSASSYGWEHFDCVRGLGFESYAWYFCVIIIISIYEGMLCYDMMFELWWLAWNIIGWNGYALEW